MLLDRLPPRFLVIAALLGGLTFQILLGSSYVAASLDPVAESEGVPVAVVNLDDGTAGDTFLDRLEAQDTPVAWVRVDAESDALRGLEEKRYHGALVVPANFSAAVGSFTSDEPERAVLHVLTNPGASTAGSFVADRVMARAADAVRARVQDTALNAADPAGVGAGAVTLDQARWLAAPVVVERETVNAVPANGGAGLAPTYLAMAAWVGGYIGALALERFREKTQLTAAWRVLIFPAAAVAQAVVATGVLLAVGLNVPDALVLAAVLAAGTWMAYAVVGVLVDVFSVPGAVPAFAVLAFGLPASGAFYPVEMLPPLYQALHAWSPFTWMVEALRTVLYAPAAGDVTAYATRLAGLAVTASGLALALDAWRARRGDVTLR